MYEELIKSLRICGDWTGQVRLVGRDCCDGCKYQKNGVCESFNGNKELLLIEAADAIEQLSNAGSAYGRGWTLGYDAGRKESKTRWIPVTERLPEIKEHHVSDVVLVYLDDGGMAFSELEENIFGQVWFDLERPRPDGESDCTVTHWMPLPTPPGEEETE